MRKDTGKEGSEDISDHRKSQEMLPGISAPGSVPGTQGGAEGAWTPHRGGAAVNVNRQFKTGPHRGTKVGEGNKARKPQGESHQVFITERESSKWCSEKLQKGTLGSSSFKKLMDFTLKKK